MAKIELGAFLYYFFCYPAPRSLREKLRTKHTYIELTYGETSYGSFQKIIEELQLNVCDTLRFCDLGCGRGRLLWYAAIVKAWECCGLDAIPAYIKRGQRVVAREGLSNVSFIQGDFCEID